MITAQQLSVTTAQQLSVPTAQQLPVTTAQQLSVTDHSDSDHSFIAARLSATSSDVISLALLLLVMLVLITVCQQQRFVTLSSMLD